MFMGNFRTVFQNGCAILRSHQQCTRGSVALNPHQCLVVVIFSNLAILMGTQWNPMVVLICICLMAVEHLSVGGHYSRLGGISCCLREL